MPLRDPVGKIQSLDDRVKGVTVICSVRLWDRGHDGSMWVHPSVVINIPPVSWNINTTIQTPDGEVVPITVSRYVRLLEVDDGWLNSGARPILCVSPEWVHNTYRPSYLSSWKQYLS